MDLINSIVHLGEVGDGFCHKPAAGRRLGGGWAPNCKSGRQMNKLKYLLLYLILVSSLVSVPAEATLINKCVHLINSLRLQPQDWSNEKVEIIYFPSGIHTKLRIGEDVYGNECPDGSCVHHRFDALDRLKGMGGGVQIRFGFKATQEDVANLRKFISDKKFGEKSITCTHSACAALNKSTGIKIPIPFNISPFSNAAFLAASRFLPGTRIDEISFGGSVSKIPTALLVGTMTLLDEIGIPTMISIFGYLGVHRYL